MEHLTRQQIILLALFVSFFSSIATGIVVVSLMDQSTPTPTVTQTINRIVERTVEKASPSQPSGKEIVIVKDDQAIINAISNVNKSIVRITGVASDATTDRYVGIGIIASDSGKIIADLQSVAPGESLYAHLDGGNTVSVSYISTDPDTQLSLFQADQSNDPRSTRAYSPVLLGDSDSVKLGQAVIFISGYKTPIVATGIVSSIVQDRIIANVPDKQNFDSQVILVNLLGEVIGIRDTGETFIPSNLIKKYATTSTLHN